jgi:acetyl-CoA carboxylase biotin carboxyl carrier protein
MKTQKDKEQELAGTVDWAGLERLLEFMEEHGLEECEYAKGDFRVRLRKPSSGMMLQPSTIAMQPEAGRGAPPARGLPSREHEAGLSAAAAADEEKIATGHIVKSPIVGTYYESPNPGASAFVKVGDHVSAGQVICIVEAMKLMNEIEADVAGQVTKVFMHNGQPVEYGQPLFSIQPASPA